MVAKKKEVAKKVTAIKQVMNPDEMLTTLVQNGADPETLSKFMDLKERHENNEARKAYVVAMNYFKADPPEIFKDKHVSYGTTEYSHASLANIVKVIGEALARHELSHRWDVDQLDGGIIKVTCVITHSMGHSESVPMQSGADQSGGKNNIQAIGSTTTYLQRYTLLAATGLATMDMDCDGQDSEAEPVELINEEQANKIHSAISENGLDLNAFLKWLKSEKAESIECIRADFFKIVMARVNSAIRAKKK